MRLAIVGTGHIGLVDRHVISALQPDHKLANDSSESSDSRATYVAFSLHMRVGLTFVAKILCLSHRQV